VYTSQAMKKLELEGRTMKLDNEEAGTLSLGNL
jgi:hypothetical protein